MEDKEISTLNKRLDRMVESATNHTRRIIELERRVHQQDSIFSAFKLFIVSLGSIAQIARNNVGISNNIAGENENGV